MPSATQPTAPERESLALRIELEGADAADFAAASARIERTPTQQVRFLIRQFVEQHRQAANPAA